MKYAIVGGGVAGVCCAEELCRLRPDDQIILISADRTLKGVNVVARLTQSIEEVQGAAVRVHGDCDVSSAWGMWIFQHDRVISNTTSIAVVEKRLDEGKWPNLQFVLGQAVALHLETSTLELADGTTISFDRLCIATGAMPLPLPLQTREAEGSILTLRDTDSIDRLVGLLRNAKHVAIVGNGGIALELVHALHSVDITWVVKHSHIADAFFDIDAADFLLEVLRTRRALAAAALSEQNTSMPIHSSSGKANGGAATAQSSSIRGLPSESHPPGSNPGHAVGPSWVRTLAGTDKSPELPGGKLDIECNCTVRALGSSSSPGLGSNVQLELTNGKQITADFVVAALGVTPNTEWLNDTLQRGPDGGIVVNERLESVNALGRIWAAGDVSCMLELENRPVDQTHWFQMRLWTQARSEGILAAHSMAGVDEDTGASMALELFTHVTSFAGLKVVLLGRYNGQGLEAEPSETIISYCRSTTPDEKGNGATFVRLLLRQDRVEGAVLIGETGMEEAVEHLILDRLVVGHLMPGLLDPNTEFDEVFD